MKLKKEIIITLREKNLKKRNTKLFVNLTNIYNNEKKLFYFNKRWSQSDKLLKDFNYLDKIYEKNLVNLSGKLNKYHDKNFPIRFWRIIIGKWLYRFICCTYERYMSILDLNQNYRNLYFKFYQYDYKNFIPYGIEDFNYFVGTHAWNNYIYSEIISWFKLKHIEKIRINNFLDISEFKETYQRLTKKKHSLKGKVYSHVLNFLGTFNKKKDYFIFDTYLKNQDELNLNYKLNKNPTIFKPPKFENILSLTSKYRFIKNFRESEKEKLNQTFDKFISNLVFKNLPKSYLEYFEEINLLIKKMKVPKNPKVIFTTRGINRNTLMDNYIALKTLNKSKLIIGQHGGNYGQHKGHWVSKHESEISDNFLSWSSKKSVKNIPVGVIKNVEDINYKNTNKMILFETRSRLLYSHDFKIDYGAINSEIYFEKTYKFLSLLKDKEISKNFFIKNNSKNFGWDEKKIFQTRFKNLNFVNSKLKTADFMKKTKLIIYSFPSTGHLECMSTNIPMMMFYFNDDKLLNKETQIYFQKLNEIGILHKNPQSLYKKMLEIKADPGKWWYSKKVQKVVQDYSSKFCRKNKNLVEELFKIIKKN